MAKDSIAVVLKTVTVKHNGKIYGPKAEVSLPPSLAEKLIASGDAEAATGKKAAAAPAAASEPEVASAAPATESPA